MTLRTKFAWVVVLLAGTLGVNVGASVWGIRFLERELAWPLESVQSVMDGLHRVKRAGEEQAALIGAGRAAGPAPVSDADSTRQRFGQLSDQIRGTLAELDGMQSYMMRSGISTTRNLRERSADIERHGDAWLRGDQSAWAPLVAALDERHELIERLEGRLIHDAALAVGHGESLRYAILVIIGVSVAGAGAVAALTILLVRRWVLVPVSEMREGAERLGRGEFDHRIPVHNDDELSRLAREFNVMAGLIRSMQDERVERERLAAMGEMARRIVHNLRTPLAGIRALAETTRSELDPASDLIGVQDRVIASVDRFEAWLQGMLRASSPLDLHPAPFDPRPLVGAVVEAHAPAGSARRVRVRLVDAGLPPRVVGDAHHLEQALTALVSNAIDFAPEGGEVVVEGSAADGVWTVRVVDGGPGVPEHLRQAIFRPYFTTRQGGTGIGLALVRRVAEQHGGTIAVESPTDRDSGLGSAFELRLPIDAGGG